jgi:hypothetical protein
MKRGLLFLLAIVTPAYAQFQLSTVTGDVEFLTPPVFDFGVAAPAQPLRVTFRVRNVFPTPASLDTLSVAGAGFTLLGPPALPRTLDPHTALEFTVQFQSEAAQAYSAFLTLPGLSVILTARVVPGLIWRVPAAVDFGSVLRGQSAAFRFAVENHSAIELAVPPIAVSGDGFSLDGPSPAGVVLQAQQSATFGLRFTPSAGGPSAGTLAAGDRTFRLAAMGVDPPLPKPLLNIDLPQSLSARQGTAQISLDAAAPVAASGTLTLEFEGPADPTVTFASGGRQIEFTIAPGDTRVPDALFQTGTSAGTLVFTATLGGIAARQTIVIPPAPVAVTTTQASRAAGSLTLQLTGFDNTRTAGPLAFTFYDRSGSAIPPAPIPATADFQAFFQTSGLGGLFTLTAVFSVTGDASQIAAVEVQFTNAAGTATIPRTSF